MTATNGFFDVPADASSMLAGTARSRTVGELARDVAEAVRALNHLTRPGVITLREPAELCEVVADLTCAAQRLPQLLGQLSTWLVTESRTNRLTVDAWSPHRSADAAVAHAVDFITDATRFAHALSCALETAHQTLAHLAEV
jgi:hypothetical protein